MKAARAIPCVFARGGTSRGAFLLRSDLPADQSRLNAVLLAIYGSPDLRQIDGLGGGDPLTSKVAVVAQSARPDADVDYTFGQVSVTTPDVFWAGNCGNMSSGVGPYAISTGLVKAVSPETKVRIYNTNTDKVLTARVQVRDGEVVEEGDTRIAGVHGTGAPIYLDFGDCAGAGTGSLLPTGRDRDRIALSDGRKVDVSVVDATTPFVFVAARDVGMVGTELPAAIDADPELLGRLEEVRAWAARKLGLVADGEIAREVSPSVPRVSVVSSPTEFVTSDGMKIARDDICLVARQQAMQRTHKAYAVTGTLCTSVAASIPGTVVAEQAAAAGGTFRIGHPSGVIEAHVRTSNGPDGVRIEEASLVRTSRVIMRGTVHVPRAVWP